MKIRLTTSPVALALLLVFAAAAGFSQSDSSVESFFKQNIGLTRAQIDAIHSGQAVAKALPSRTPAEVFLFGAVYLRGVPEKYLQFDGDFERRRKLSGYLELGKLGNPPRLEDFKGFSFDKDDMQALKDCKPNDCLLQIPASAIEELHRTINWSDADAADQANRRLQETALERILEYQREGNRVLGVYNDKRNPVDVPRELEYLLSYSRVIPARLPAFYGYLLTYPRDKPANVEDTFYWERVKFGLKPTLRVVHRSVMRGNEGDSIACAIAEKQLYASHYFQTAMNLTFCVRPDSSLDSGFFLIMLAGSEQAGLTGAKGSLVRQVAVGRSVSNVQGALTAIKNSIDPK